MKHSMQLRQRSNIIFFPDEQKKEANKLLTSLKELFGDHLILNLFIYTIIKSATGAELFEQVKLLGITYIEEIEEKGYEIVFVNQKLVLQKKESNQKIERDDCYDAMTQSELERRYVNDMNSYKEKIYYDLFFDQAKINSNLKSDLENFEDYEYSNIDECNKSENLNWISNSQQNLGDRPIQFGLRNRRGNTLSDFKPSQSYLKKNSVISRNLSIECTPAKKRRGRKKKNDPSNLKTNQNSQASNLNYLSCFTSEPNSPVFYGDTDGRSPHTPIIKSFNPDQKDYKDQYDSKERQKTIKTQYLSDKEISETPQNIKISKFCQNQNKQNKTNGKPNDKGIKSKQKQKRPNSNLQANQLTEKIQNRKVNNNTKIKNQKSLNQDDQFTEIIMSKPNSTDSPIEDLEAYEAYKDINIFEHYDNLLVNLVDKFHTERRQEQDSQDTQTYSSQQSQQSEQSVNQFEREVYEQRIRQRNKFIPRKLKVKTIKRYPKINNIFMQINYSSNNFIQYNQQSAIYQSDFYPDYY